MRTLTTENENIIVEYDYARAKYIIKNIVLGDTSSTERATAQDTLNVVKILIPSTAITVEDLTTLATYQEEVDTESSLAYKYDKDYFYLKEIVINGYETYKLQVDTEKAIIHITNSNVAFDLTLNEALTERVYQISNFYQDKLLLNVPTVLVRELYDLLLASYTPQVVNEIVEGTNIVTNEPTLVYSNLAILNDFSQTAKSSYYLTNTTVTDTTLNVLANVYYIDRDTNIIYLTNTPSKSLAVGDTIKLYNTTNNILGEDFTDDGSYIVEEIISNTEIKIKGVLPISYKTPTPKFYMVYSTFNIQSSSTSENSIVVTEDIASSLSVGDEIQVINTTVTGEYGSSTTLDGIYTIREINGSTIFTNEIIPTNYTYDTSYEKQGLLFQKAFISDIISIANDSNYSIVSLLNNCEYTLNVNSPCAIINIEGELSLCKIALTSITPNKVNVVNYYEQEQIQEFEADYGELRKDMLGEAIQVNVENSKDEKVLPKGEFTLLNSNQCSEYLKLLKGNTIPTTTVYSNFGKVVETTKEIEINNIKYTLTMEGLDKATE